MDTSHLIDKRIKLTFTDDKYTELRPGSLGKINYVDHAGTICVRWDSGSTLGLIPGVDRYEILPDDPPADPTT